MPGFKNPGIYYFLFLPLGRLGGASEFPKLKCYSVIKAP